MPKKNKKTYLYLRIDGADYWWSLKERADADITTLDDFAHENPDAAARIQTEILHGVREGRLSVLPPMSKAPAPLFAKMPERYETYTLGHDGIATAQGPAWTANEEAFQVRCRWPDADADGGAEEHAIILTRTHIRALAALEQATPPQSSTSTLPFGTKTERPS